MDKKDFILASASPQRFALLEQIGCPPKTVAPADIDESVRQYETPTAYVKRMALEKALNVANKYPDENILAGDTIVAVGRRILRKAHNDEEQTEVMNLLSGRACRVISAVCLISRDGRVAERCVMSRVVTKKMNEEEIRDYVASREWVGCCGYKIEGRFAGYVSQIVGSYSGIVGLPLFETQNLLKGIGVK
uniref:Nucleoside triphosphate pyrophosphatase n=1 Tax=uncultured Alphaproteobacteria bacterium TaxID=91750 RepID=A0A6G8F2K1_9PROT|nr:Maf-like protein [uncultured Alphaproteobacteria bacterium]